MDNLNKYIGFQTGLTTTVDQYLDNIQTENIIIRRPLLQHWPHCTVIHPLPEIGKCSGQCF